MNRYPRYVAVCILTVGLFAGAAFLAIGMDDTSATVAYAQDGDSGAIKVIGYGDAEAPADMVSVTLSAGGNGAFYGPEGPEFEPVEEESLSIIADALTESGIAAETIALNAFGPSFYGPDTTSAQVQFDYDAPSNLSTFLVDVMEIIKESRGPKIQSAQAVFQVEECLALEATAMQAALDNARARAEVMAEQMGVTLGAMTDVSEMLPSALGYGAVGAGNCSSIESATHRSGFGGSSLGTNSADVVEVSINIEATFSIE